MYMLIQLFHVFAFVCLSSSEFQILANQKRSPWVTFFSKEPVDCSESGKRERFPNIFGTEDRVQTTIGPPRNFSVQSFEREALELRGMRNYFYPGAVISFIAPQTDAGLVTGYELTLSWNQRYVCIIVDFTAISLSAEERIEIELFPLFGLVHFQLALASLPKYTTAQRCDVIHFTTGPFNKYRNVNRALPPSANWYADVAYYVISSNDTDDNETRFAIEIVFSRPPEQYNFELFEITLVPRGDNSGIRRARTSKFYHVFDNVSRGRYKVMIKPVDEFFSQNGRCLCRELRGACANCISAEMEAVVT